MVVDKIKMLITGGAGYIGSTIASCLLDRGHTPIILDSLVKGRREFTVNRIFYQGDIADSGLLKQIIEEHPSIDYVIHCAALTVVSDSIKEPYSYYRENITKSLEMFKALYELGIMKIILSSSASIYQASHDFRVDETTSVEAICPYAYTKISTERILEDFCVAYQMKGIALRYFNPIGADPKLQTGPYDKTPTHLLGNLIEVASKRKAFLEINGANWQTRDGTAIRDYVHVWDLAEAHVLAIEKFDAIVQNENHNYTVINLGSEQGVTVKEFVSIFEKVHGKQLTKKVAGPRLGDRVGAYAISSKAKKQLGWKPDKSLEDGIRDALSWNDKRREMLGY